jgi:hypothetical protein
MQGFSLMFLPAGAFLSQRVPTTFPTTLVLAAPRL